MKYPKEAILFEGIKTDSRDACIAGEIYEYAGPSNQKGLIRVVRAFNSHSVMDEGWQAVLFTENVKALTPLAQELLDSPQHQDPAGRTATSCDIVFDEVVS